jgi:hypothetical protein
VNSSPVLPLLVAVAVAIFAGVAYAKRTHRAETSTLASSLEAHLTTDNPLQMGSNEPTDTRESLTTTTVQRTDDAYMLVRVLYQPARILVGYVQVVSQIGVVLDIPYPDAIQAVFDALKPLAGLLTQLFHLECIGHLTFHQQWIARVFIMPLLLSSVAVARYAYVRHRGDDTAAKNAVGGLKSDAFFILFLVYRA